MCDHPVQYRRNEYMIGVQNTRLIPVASKGNALNVHTHGQLLVQQSAQETQQNRVSATQPASQDMYRTLRTAKQAKDRGLLVKSKTCGADRNTGNSAVVYEAKTACLTLALLHYLCLSASLPVETQRARTLLFLSVFLHHFDGKNDP